MSATVIIARKKDSLQAIHIDDVVKGAAHSFECPGCNIALIPVKGEQKAHHFRHYGSIADKCRETALHLFAKQVIVENLSMNYTTGIIEYQDPKAEQQVGIYRSDVSAIYLNQPIHFEIIVSHDFVDTLKEQYYISNNIKCLRIDLSDKSLLTATKKIIQFAVLEDITNKEFLSSASQLPELYLPSDSSVSAVIIGSAFLVALGLLFKSLTPKRKRIISRNRYR